MNAKLFVACAVTLGAGSLAAQRVAIDASLANSDKPYVQAGGDGVVSVKPDEAVVDIKVTSEGTTAAGVAAQNAKQTDAVLADLKLVLGPGKNMRTTSCSVRPNYQTPKPGSTPTIMGYTATNIVEVTLDDLTLVNKVIDAATGTGANVIQSLRYQLKDPSVVRAQALRQAAEKAKAATEAIAAGLGVKIVRILWSAEEPMGGS